MPGPQQKTGPDIGDLKRIIGEKEIELDFGRQTNRQLAGRVQQLTEENKNLKEHNELLIKSLPEAVDKKAEKGTKAIAKAAKGTQRDNGDERKTDPVKPGDQPRDAAERSGTGRAPTRS